MHRRCRGYTREFIPSVPAGRDCKRTMLLCIVDCPLVMCAYLFNGQTRPSVVSYKLKLLYSSKPIFFFVRTSALRSDFESSMYDTTVHQYVQQHTGTAALVQQHSYRSSSISYFVRRVVDCQYEHQNFEVKTQARRLRKGADEMRSFIPTTPSSALAGTLVSVVEISIEL